MDEETLFSGYRNVRPPAEPVSRTFTLGRLRFRPCYCGSWLGFDHSRPDECKRLVESHELTARHQAWAVQTNLSLIFGREAYGGR